VWKGTSSRLELSASVRELSWKPARYVREGVVLPERPGRAIIGTAAPHLKSSAARKEHQSRTAAAHSAHRRRTVPDPTTPGLYLKTFGTAALFERTAAVCRMRHKDLALLIFLRLAGTGAVSRSLLGTLLWGEGAERTARHSLSQALGRLRSCLGQEVLSVTRDAVEWHGDLACDAALLDEPSEDPGAACQAYTGDFVAGLMLGPGADDFEAWADAKRAHYRLRAVQLLERCAGEAERRGEPERALRLSLRAVEIEPLFEAAHRRVMRAWEALGERAFALRHYRAFERTLRAEVGTLPDPCTRALAAQLCDQGA
jgi:DNA-binding SARP family transcriptional activator